MLESFFSNVLHMCLESTNASEIETKKLNLINPFNQVIVYSESKITIAINFTTREIDDIALVRAIGEFLMAALEKDVFKCNLKVLTAFIQSVPDNIGKDGISINKTLDIEPKDFEEIAHENSEEDGTNYYSLWDAFEKG